MLPASTSNPASDSPSPTSGSITNNSSNKAVPRSKKLTLSREALHADHNPNEDDVAGVWVEVASVYESLQRAMNEKERDLAARLTTLHGQTAPVHPHARRSAPTVAPSAWCSPRVSAPPAPTPLESLCTVESSANPQLMKLTAVNSFAGPVRNHMVELQRKLAEAQSIVTARMHYLRQQAENSGHQPLSSVKGPRGVPPVDGRTKLMGEPSPTPLLAHTGGSWKASRSLKPVNRTSTQDSDGAKSVSLADNGLLVIPEGGDIETREEVKTPSTIMCDIDFTNTGEQLSARAGDHTMSLHAFQTDVYTLTQQLSECQSEKSELQNSLRRSADDIAKAEDRARTATAAQASLEHELLHAKTQQRAMQGKVEALEECAIKLMTEKSELQHRIDSMQEELKQLRADESQMRGLFVSRALTSPEPAKTSSHKKPKPNYQATIDFLVGDITRLTAENDAAKEHLTVMEGALHHAAVVDLNMRQSLANLGTQVHSLTDANMQLQHKMASLERSSHDLAQEKLAMAAQIALLNASADLIKKATPASTSELTPPVTARVVRSERGLLRTHSLQVMPQRLRLSMSSLSPSGETTPDVGNAGLKRTVYVKRTGLLRKYHRAADCGSLTYVSTSMSEAEAVSRQLEKCAVCWNSNEF